ncbi:MAG TPA: response regulator, partial [Burkholderiaceae bacterium]|nr:response regulator [Burkholderiaceae bacterium]
FRDKPRRLRVMIVDDNADAAESLALLLDIDGHQVRTELSGSAALAAAAEFMPDVVFCDLGLPGVSGHDVAASVRSDPRFAATTLVALTGWGSDEDRRRARDAGFDFHLTKPASAAAIDQILLQI